jgi:hypothetical protein
MGEGRDLGRPEGKRPLGRPRRRWEDNIEIDLREMGIHGTNWIRLAKGRVRRLAFVNTVMNLGLQKESRLFSERLSNYQIFEEYPAP